MLSFTSIVVATNASDFISHGAKQAGVAGAGAAEAADSTWITMNPASITELTNRFDFHYEYFSPRRVVKMDGFGTNPNRDVDTEGSFIPNTSLVYELSETERFGLGLFTYAGANTQLSNSRTFLGQQGGYDRKVDYWTMKLVAVYAKKFENGWSVGFGPSIIYSKLRTDISTATFAQTKGSNEWDDSWGAGFTFGVHKRWDKWAWGLGYSSKQWTESFKKYNDVFSAMDHPQNIQTGLSYKLTDELTWLLDYKWIDWDSVNFLGNKASEGGLGWDDQHIIKTGLVWKITDKTTLRTGYSYARAAMGNEDAFVNSLFPTPIEHHLTFGASHMLNENLELTVSYIRGFTNSFIENNRNLPAPVATGTEVSLSVDIIGIGISWYF